MIGLLLLFLLLLLLHCIDIATMWLNDGFTFHHGFLHASHAAHIIFCKQIILLVGVENFTGQNFFRSDIFITELLTHFFEK